MKNYSNTLTYQNGNKLLIGDEGDHVSVRKLINSGVISNVNNFGPLLNKQTATTFIETDNMEKKVVGDYELYIKPSNGYSISLSTGQSESLEGFNNVFYQRISK